MTTSANNVSATIEALPTEIVQRIASNLNKWSLCNFRLAMPLLDDETRRRLFTTIRIRPSSQSAARVEQIANTAIRNIIRHIEFDLEAAFTKDIHHRRRHLQQGTTDDYETPVPYYGAHSIPDDQSMEDPIYRNVLHFGARQFLAAFRKFDKVEEVKVMVSHKAADHYGQADVINQTMLFFQVLELLKQLPGSLTRLIVDPTVHDTFSFKMVNLKAAQPFYPTLNQFTPPLALSSVRELQAEASLKVFNGLQKLDINLYHGDRRSFLDGFVYFHEALIAMSPTLKSLSFGLLRSGNGVWARNRCMDHSSLQHYYAVTDFDAMLLSHTFPQLETLHLRDLTYKPSELGTFLSTHSSTLQQAHVSQWRCLPWIMDAEAMQELRTAAGDSMSVLTLESCGDFHKDLCRSQVLGELGYDRGIGMWKWYWQIPANKLASLLLEENLSQAAVLHAISYVHRVELTSYDGRGVIMEPRRYMYNLGGAGGYHYTLKDHEFPQHVKRMEQLEVPELARRGSLTEKLLQEYCETHGAQHHGEQCDHDILNLRAGSKCCGNGEIFVLIINGEPGLYSWRSNEYYQCDIWGIRKWNPEKCLKEHAEGVFHHPEDEHCWTETVETDKLNAILDLGGDGITLPGKPGRHRSRWELMYQKKGPEALWIYVAHIYAFQSPDMREMRHKFEFNFEGLEEDRACREEAIIRAAEEAARAERRAALVEEWEAYHEQRKSTRSKRRSRRHWELVALRRVS